MNITIIEKPKYDYKMSQLVNTYNKEKEIFIMDNCETMIQELMCFRKDAKITILNTDNYINGLDKPPIPYYHVILSWDYNKKTEDGTPYNSFTEFWAETVAECLEQLVKDIRGIKENE